MRNLWLLVAVAALTVACGAPLALATAARAGASPAATSPPATSPPVAAGAAASPGAVTGDTPAPADTTPPTSTSDAPSGWQNAPFTVTFTAGDDASGVATVWSWLDDEAPQSGLRSPCRRRLTARSTACTR